VTITDDEFLVDLRDNPDQEDGPTNTRRDGTIVSAQMVFKSLTDPDTPANDGSFRLLKVLTREGSVFHAQKRGAIGFYFEADQGFLQRAIHDLWSNHCRLKGARKVLATLSRSTRQMERHSAPHSYQDLTSPPMM